MFATSLLVRARSDSCPDDTWDLHFLPWLEEADGRLADERGRLPAQAGFTRQRHAALARSARPPRHRPRLPLRTARPRAARERHRADPHACRAGGLRTRAPARRSRSARRAISGARCGASSIPRAPVRSGRSSTHAARYWASTGWSSQTPRSCRRSPAPTRTSAPSPSPNGSPTGSVPPDRGVGRTGRPRRGERSRRVASDRSPRWVRRVGVAFDSVNRQCLRVQPQLREEVA